MEPRDIVLALLILVVGAAIFYLLDPTLGGLIKNLANQKREGFENNDESFDSQGRVIPESDSQAPGVGVPSRFEANGPTEAYLNTEAPYAENNNNVNNDNLGNAPAPAPNGNDVNEGFETLSPAPMPFKDAEKPANCYPKDQINPAELLPNDPNSKWAQVNPMGQGDIAGKNYLSAGALIGVNTIGQSLRNANYQLRSDPPNPQVKVSIWNQSTIEPDINRRALEIG
jgi:hypothetical protein